MTLAVPKQIASDADLWEAIHFAGAPLQHCRDYLEYLRLERIKRRNQQAYRAVERYFKRKDQ